MAGRRITANITLLKGTAYKGVHVESGLPYSGQYSGFWRSLFRIISNLFWKSFKQYVRVERRAGERMNNRDKYDSGVCTCYNPVGLLEQKENDRRHRQTHTHIHTRVYTHAHTHTHTQTDRHTHTIAFYFLQIEIPVACCKVSVVSAFLCVACSQAHLI